MPLYWTIDSKEQLVTVTAEGDVSRAEMEEYLDAVAGAGALAYRKLLDATALRIFMPMDDMLAVGVRLREYHSQPVGPLAIVMSAENSQILARILGIMATADRPMRIFKTLGPAKRWIAAFRPPVGGRRAGS